MFSFLCRRPGSCSSCCQGSCSCYGNHCCVCCFKCPFGICYLKKGGEIDWYLIALRCVAFIEHNACDCTCSAQAQHPWAWCLRHQVHMPWGLGVSGCVCGGTWKTGNKKTHFSWNHCDLSWQCHHMYEDNAPATVPRCVCNCSLHCFWWFGLLPVELEAFWHPLPKVCEQHFL